MAESRGTVGDVTGRDRVMKHARDNQAMADDNNIISFEEYRRKLRGVKDEASPLDELFKKDLREQQDLVDWYTFHNTFNRLKLFVHCLFHQNEARENPNAGFVVAFEKGQLERAVKQLDEALRWAGRRIVAVDAGGRTFCQLAEALTGRPHRTKFDAFESFKHVLLETDKVIVVQELPASKLGADKAGTARSLIKIIDDAHFHGVVPRSGLIFLDYAAFLQEAWSLVGIYLTW